MGNQQERDTSVQWYFRCLILRDYPAREYTQASGSGRLRTVSQRRRYSPNFTGDCEQHVVVRGVSSEHS
jgi:hypothetical protein